MSTVTTRWWWVRHAPVAGRKGRIYGVMDVEADVADEAALSALAGRLPGAALWVTSHLMRAKQTATALAAAGADIETCVVEPDLAEQDFGSWQGLTYAEIDQARGASKSRFWLAPARHTPPGGESFADVAARVTRVVTRLNAAHGGRDIVAVAHGGPIRAALGLALGLDLETALRFSIDHLSLTRLDHIRGADGDDAWRVVAVNRPAT
ncbi:MAG: histidine phosphatase family protein [Alphaproteobacteria bacterium]